MCYIVLLLLLSNINIYIYDIINTNKEYYINAWLFWRNKILNYIYNKE